MAGFQAFKSMAMPCSSATTTATTTTTTTRLSFSSGGSVPSTMGKKELEFGPRGEEMRRRSSSRMRMGFSSPSFSSSSLCLRRHRPAAVQALSHTESAEGNVTIVEDSETFDRLLQEAGERLVVLDISTKTCGPCKIIFPKVVQLSIKYPDVVFLKINGDTSADTRALMRKWGVRAVPNFRFFRNGELVHSHTGAKLDELKAHLANHYNATIKT